MSVAPLLVAKLFQRVASPSLPQVRRLPTQFVHQADHHHGHKGRNYQPSCNVKPEINLVLHGNTRICRVALLLEVHSADQVQQESQADY